MSHTSASIYENDTFQLTSSILPENSNEPKKVLWESLNSSIAEVDQRGKVKGKSPGNTTIKFSVNDFIQTCNISVIAVPADSKDSAAEIIKQAETLLATQTSETKGEDVMSDTAGNLPISFTEAVKNLVGMLRGQEDLDPENFKQAIMEISQQVPNFVTYLSEDEAQLLDTKILEIFKENLKINLSTSEIPVQITGLALNVDLISLCKGEKITVDVMLNKQISQEDQKRLSAYASEKNIDMSLIYSFDITINQKTGENSTKLTSLYRPVKVTLQLPEQFIGIGDLEIIRIHNSEPSIHPVQLNDDLTFTFETDQFSSFTLVKASLKNNVISEVVNPKFEDPILPVTNRSINSNAWLNVSLVLILLILSSAAVIVVRKKKVAR